jgi:hypothetical protein
MAYWKSKLRITTDNHHLIQWETLGKTSIKSLDITQRRFIMKWASNNMGTGHKMLQWKHRQKGDCPYYKDANKDVPHLL